MPLDLQALIIFLVIGAIAGWLAGTLVKGYGFGLLGNIVIGIIGAYIGAWLLPQIGFGMSGLIGAIVSATIGAIVLLLLIGLVRKVA
ncbi:Transglycosylase-associated protein [Hyphomicrobium sp. 1Nfss2.1]